MHWLDSQIAAGGAHSLSSVQLTLPPSQRPVVLLQKLPSPQLEGVQPGTHCIAWQIVDGGLQALSSLHMFSCGSMQVPCKQTCGLVHCPAFKQSAHWPTLVSQCFPIALHVDSSAQLRR